MRRFALNLAASIALLLAAAAPAQGTPEGLYVTEIREMASGLELQPDGRFRWAFTYGAMDMVAEGRWRAEPDGTVVLDTEPPVEPPRVEFLGSGREPGPTLVVRIADMDGSPAPYLHVEADYGSGEPGHAYFADDAYRFEQDRRPVRAVRIGIRMFGYLSEPFPVPRGANLMRFRFDPRDLGRGDFRGARAVPDGDYLLVPVLGEPLRYRRLSAREEISYRGIIDDIAAEVRAGAATAESVTHPIGGEPVAIPVDVALGEAIDPALERALPALAPGLQATSGRVDTVRLRIGGGAIDFGSVGGHPSLFTAIGAGADGTVETLAFTYQDRLLTAAELVDRARELERRLGEAGFAPPAVAANAEPFTVTARMAGDGELRGGDWEDAGRLLADPAAGVIVMQLFTLEAGEALATAYAENLSLHAARAGSPESFVAEDGREWVLHVTIARDATGEQPDDYAIGDATAEPEEDSTNWRRCADSGQEFSRAEAIAGCTVLIEVVGLEAQEVAMLRFNRGNLLTDDGQYERAIADYDEALRLDPDLGMAYWGRSGAYGRLGDYRRALADSREAARRVPDDPDVLNYLCWYSALNDVALDEARAACDASLALRPDDPETLDSRAMVGLRQRRFAEAWADYDAAFALDPERGDFLYGRGIAALRLGREREGRADLERAERLRPGIADLFERYGVRP